MISIIVPVFNSASTIERCIESVISQVYSDWEIILVNDGSTDNTIDVIEASIKKHKEKRIILINKNNTGVSDSRNVGLDNASGDYITFLDSDDQLESHYLEKHIHGMTDGVDLVISKSGKTHAEEGVFEYGEIYKNRTLPWPFPFCKLFKSSIIRDNDIRFDKKLNLCEDWTFVMRYIIHVRKIRIIDYNGYLYNTNNGASLSRGCTFETRVYSYDVALGHLKELFMIKGIEDIALIEAIRQSNYFYAIQQLYTTGNSSYNERKRRWKDYGKKYLSGIKRCIVDSNILILLLDSYYKYLQRKQ